VERDLFDGKEGRIIAGAVPDKLTDETCGVKHRACHVRVEG
jgi:hypothetical protein